MNETRRALISHLKMEVANTRRSLAEIRWCLEEYGKEAFDLKDMPFGGDTYADLYKEFLNTINAREKLIIKARQEEYETKAI